MHLTLSSSFLIREDKSTPSSRVTCFESRRCTKRDCDLKSPVCSYQDKDKEFCDTLLETRTCVFEDLYYDVQQDTFIFYDPDLTSR